MAKLKREEESAEAMQTVQEAALDVPNTVAGTDSTTTTTAAADSQQNAPQAPEAGVGASEVGKLVYVGPSLPRGRLKSNTIFEGTREEIFADPNMEAVLKRYPLVKNMLVPISKLAEAKQKIKTAGNALHKFYADMDSLAASERMEE